MALIKCKECGNDISTKADACPHCGAKRPKQNSGCLAVLVILIGLVFVGRVLAPTNEPSTPASPSHTSSGEDVSTAIDPLYTQWHYQKSSDEMSTGIIKEAIRFSSNTNEFQFPYSEPQHAALIFRKHPRFGADAFLKIERGQILCRSYDECSIQIRFDEEPAEFYSGVGASDGSTETVFIKGYERLLDKVSKAKRVRVSVEVYHEGSPVWDFDVIGFDKSKYLSS